MKPFFAILLCLSPFLATGQDPAPSIVHAYIRTALDQNIGLKQEHYAYDQSQAVVAESRSAFLPTLSLQARYSIARGGRSFDLPLGDLMNPVYQNLNLLNQAVSDASPGYPSLPGYPNIANEQVNFLRETEQETFLRLAMPLWNPALRQNRRMQEALSAAEREGLTEYQRQLVEKVKVAYFQYLKAREGVALYNNTMELVQANLRTSESLYAHHQVTIDEVYAARAQVEQVEQDLAQARKAERVARAFFNTLLNRPHPTPIEVEPPTEGSQALPDLQSAINRALQERETFRQVDRYLEASAHRIELESGQALPTIGLAVDYGIQGTNYSFEPGADYVMGSVVLQWNLFDRKRKHRVEQARLARAELGQQRRAIQQQITLQVIDSYSELEAVGERRQSARAETTSAESAYRLIERKYRQGQANQVELINARTQMTNAERRAIIADYDYQIALARLERATGGFRFFQTQ